MPAFAAVPSDCNASQLDVPPSPRALPEQVVRAQYVNARTVISAALAAIGLILGVVAVYLLASAGAPLAIGITAALAAAFGGIGGFALRTTLRTGSRRIEALRHGVGALATVERSEEDRTLEVNGRRPWAITYVFEVDGCMFRGEVSTWNVSAGQQFERGSPIAVVYLAADPKVSCTWPML